MGFVGSKELSKFTTAVALCVLLAPGARAADVPRWLVEAARIPVPDHSPETSAVILLDEQSIKVDRNGTIVGTGRRAARILRQSGVESAGQLVMVKNYDSEIRAMTGWNLTEGRAPVMVTMKDVVETGLAPNTLFSDISILILPVPGAGPGSVVGFEWETERKPLSLEDVFEFQTVLPIVRARYSLTLPDGWTMEPFWVNWKPQEGQPAATRGTSRVWEFADVPAIEEEPLMPEARSLAGRLGVRIKPPGPDRRSLSSWADIGAWYEALSLARRAPDAAVSAKARELTAGAPDALSRLRALAWFVQREIRYAAVQIGVGGFRPHPASSVLANRYGDCKDKATLLASLLEATGLASHYILVNTARGNLTPDSPASLYSFNHIVLAVCLPDDVTGEGLPALVVHPRLGRLLVFDPTYPHAPLGRLPFYLQGNTALLVANGSGELLTLPMPEPKDNLLDRKGHFTLRADGTLEGRIQEIRRGTLADATRQTFTDATGEERTKLIETFLAGFFAGFRLLGSDVKDLNEPVRDLQLTYDVRIPNYAKIAGGMLVVRPRVLGDTHEKLEPKGNEPRLYPVDLGTTSEQRDEFTIELPEGYQIEGLPPAADLDLGFAAYSSRTEERGGALVFRREYRVVQPVLPADRFEEAVKFFRAMDADQRHSVLLKKTG
jgi:hypothetical protein